MFEEFILEVHSVVVGCTSDLEEITMCTNDIPRELEFSCEKFLDEHLMVAIVMSCWPLYT